MSGLLHDIESPSTSTDSMRELLTLLTLKQALARAQKTGTHDRKGALLKAAKPDALPKWDSLVQSNFNPAQVPEFAQEYLRGIYWVDDPKCYLFNSDRGTKGHVANAAWTQEFEKKDIKNTGNLIARSHFGDLKFFHAMPSSARESAPETKKKMLHWARFNVELALGSLNPNTQLKNITSSHLAKLRDLFSGQREWTIRMLLAGGDKRGKGLKDEDVRQRATGILLHMIQDSFLAGHVERVAGSGAIRQFNKNTAQASKKPTGKNTAVATSEFLRQRVERTLGAMAAIKAGGKLVFLLDSAASTEEIMMVLDKGLFRLANETSSNSFVDPDKRKPLIATAFKNMAELKKELSIHYTAGHLESRYNAVEKMTEQVYVPAKVAVSYPKGGLKASNVLSESTIGQEELKQAASSWFLKKAWFAATHPEVIRYKGTLEAIEKLSYVKKNTSGTAVGKIADALFARVENKPRDFIVVPGKPPLTVHEGHKNMLLHIVGQTVITTLFGREAADFAGDIHERDQPALITGNISTKEERQAIDNYCDMVNNLYGQELGEELALLFDITDDTEWSAELTTSYLNAVQDYFQENMGWKLKKFTPQDPEVTKFTLLLNEVN